MKILLVGALAGSLALGGCVSVAAIDNIIAQVHTACGIILDVTTANGFLTQIGLGNINTIIHDACSVVNPAKFASSMSRAKVSGLPDHQCYGVVDGIQVCGYAATPRQIKTFKLRHHL